MIHFMIYEGIKARLLEHSSPESSKSWDFAKCMLAAAISKTTATIIAYPHGKMMSL